MRMIRESAVREPDCSDKNACSIRNQKTILGASTIKIKLTCIRVGFETLYSLLLSELAWSQQSPRMNFKFHLDKLAAILLTNSSLEVKTMHKLFMPFRKQLFVVNETLVVSSAVERSKFSIFHIILPLCR
jgi:ammonia channel protein AmtB